MSADEEIDVQNINALNKFELI